MIPRPAAGGTSLAATPHPRLPLGPGSYPETDLQSSTIGWTGRADLVNVRSESVEIVDYKTGSRHDSHADQVRIYALLWFRDKDLNPIGRPADRLVVRYANQDVHVTAPSPPELVGLEDGLLIRTQAARAELAKRPPEARPSPENCGGCPVRQLCPEYWRYLKQNPANRPLIDRDVFADMELAVLQQSGPRSWLCAVSSSDLLSEHAQVLLRTASETVRFPIGRRMRVLDAAVDASQPSRVAVTQTSNSQTFELTI